MLLDRPPGQSMGCAILLHGFTRAPRNLDVLAAACGRQGMATIRPRLASWNWARSMNNAAYITRVARVIADLPVVGPVVVAGHSAGAAAGSWLAAELRDAGVDVRRLVLIDGNDSPTHLIERAWPRLADIPVRAVCAPPSKCNRDGRLAQWLAGQHGDIVVDVIAGSGHGDIESVSSPVYRWACGDASSPEVRAQVHERTLGWIREGLVGRPTAGGPSV